jgi:hypothetical protein
MKPEAVPPIDFALPARENRTSNTPANPLVQRGRTNDPVGMDVDGLNGELRVNGAAMDAGQSVHVLWQPSTA